MASPCPNRCSVTAGQPAGVSGGVEIAEPIAPQLPSLDAIWVPFMTSFTAPAAFTKLISPSSSDIAKVRVIAGPQEEMFTEEGIRTFYGSAYEVTALSDRMGYRLAGPKVEAEDGYDILSDGIVFGSIQISGNGQPIVMMADRQTTGGYAKIATVISADIPLFAQLRPGQKVQFEKTTVKEAQRLIREWDKAWKEHCRTLEENAPGKTRVLGLRAHASEDGGSKRHGWTRSGWKRSGWKHRG